MPSRYDSSTTAKVPRLGYAALRRTSSLPRLAVLSGHRLLGPYTARRSVTESTASPPGPRRRAAARRCRDRVHAWERP